MARATTRRRLQVKYRGKNIAQVLRLTVDDALAFFEDEAALERPLSVLREVGLGYLRLGQSATELSGGEAQRVKLATELQRAQRGDTLYILDEPTTGLHPADIDRLVAQLDTPGGGRQHGDCRRTRHAGAGGQRLGDRYRSRRRR